MGFVDYFRVPKRSWYWYRNEYLHIPQPEWPKEGTPAKLELTADKTTIQGTDATDDCQILVTVEDNSGKAISNSVPVTFTIESGPGEFPTGRSITFTPPSKDEKSDIAIRDGKAAMEFRSYFGGETVIRATSPGLEDGTITITTVGEPKFVAGQSPVAPDRPYVRFVQGNTPTADSQNIALNHPTGASSEASGHGAEMAVDGNPATSWQAADAAPGAWWREDMERLYTVTSVEVTLLDTATYQYRIEGSADGDNWILLADRTQDGGSDRVLSNACAKNDHLRWLRIVFTGLPADHPAALREVKILAKPSS